MGPRLIRALKTSLLNSLGPHFTKVCKKLMAEWSRALLHNLLFQGKEDSIKVIGFSTCLQFFGKCPNFKDKLQTVMNFLHILVLNSNKQTLIIPDFEDKRVG